MCIANAPLEGEYLSLEWVKMDRSVDKQVLCLSACKSQV